MPKIYHTVAIDYEPTFRAESVRGMFDLSLEKKLTKSWQANIPIEDMNWQIGLITGASGSGKSTLANQLFPNKIHPGFGWVYKCLLDDFPPSATVKEIVEILSRVGFSSPPQWLLPYSALSTGQKFRVELARCLFAYDDLIVFDEFTSVVDRQVAQIGAFAFQKAIRKMNKKFVAVTCHNDVEEWLQPDWVYNVSENKFYRGSLRRPTIEIEIRRVERSMWSLFKDYHYLDSNIMTNATCFAAFYNNKPIGFDAWCPFFGKLKTSQKARRGHRTVVLPDYQGLGIGGILFDTIASMWKGLGYRAFSTTGHPAEKYKRANNPKWKLTRQGIVGPDSKPGYKRSTNRHTCSFEYIGDAMNKEEAIKLYGA